jgi:hypothetical protein
MDLGGGERSPSCASFLNKLENGADVIPILKAG